MPAGVALVAVTVAVKVTAPPNVEGLVFDATVEAVATAGSWKAWSLVSFEPT